MTSREARWPSRHTPDLWPQAEAQRAENDGTLEAHKKEEQRVCGGQRGFFYLLRMKAPQTETEVFVRHQCPLVGHINCSVCLNPAPCIPSGYLWLEIEVGCQHSVRVRASVWLFVSPLVGGWATNVQLGLLHPAQTRAKNPHKTRQPLAFCAWGATLDPVKYLLTLLSSSVQHT